MEPTVSEIDEFFRKTAKTTLTKVIQDAWKGLMLGTHTIIPAQLVSYNVSTRLGSFQPTLKQKFVFNPAATPIDPIPGVPLIQWMGVKGACVFIPDSVIVPGLEVLLLVSERSIDTWYKTGGIVDPADERMFDFTDAIAFLGLSSTPNLPTRNGATTSLEIQYGTAWFEIVASGKFKMVGSSGQTLTGLLNDIVNTMNAATAGGNPVLWAGKQPSQILGEITNLLA